MKITAVRLFEVRGEMTFPGEFWEERLIRPVDIYPEHKDQGPGWLAKVEDGGYAMRSQFCEIQTDEGVIGLAGQRRPNRPLSSSTNWRPCSSATIRWPRSASGTGCTGRWCMAARGRR